MTLHPRKPTDLTLAPVAAEIDQNLQSLRDASPAEIVDSITLTLNENVGETRDLRARQVYLAAIRDVDLHGWSVAISADATRLQLRGGSVALDVGLSEALRVYIDG
jgi:hypothetical protein